MNKDFHVKTWAMWKGKWQVSDYHEIEVEKTFPHLILAVYRKRIMIGRTLKMICLTLLSKLEKENLNLLQIYHSALKKTNIQLHLIPQHAQPLIIHMI